MKILHILINNLPKFRKGLDEKAKGGIVTVASAMHLGIAASLAASVSTVLNAEWTGRRLSWQIAQHYEGQGSSKMMKFRVMDEVQAP